MPTNFLTSKPVYWPSGLAVDSEHVYLTASPEDRPYLSRGAALFRIPVGGGAVERLTVLPSTGGLAVGRGDVAVLHAGGVSLWRAGVATTLASLPGEPGFIAATENGWLASTRVEGRNILYAIGSGGGCHIERHGIDFLRGFGSFGAKTFAIVDGRLLEWPRGRTDMVSARDVPAWLDLRASEGLFLTEDAVYLVGVDRRIEDRVVALLCRIPDDDGEVLPLELKRPFCQVLGRPRVNELLAYLPKVSGASELPAALVRIDAATGHAIAPPVELDPTWLVNDAVWVSGSAAILTIQTEGLQLERSPASYVVRIDVDGG